MSDIVFTKVDFSLRSLVDHVEMGQIGLPDIQRPFVWKNTKVRNLFDSMYKGYPVGYLLFWESGATNGARTIGADRKQLTPSLLIVDGQQRLTSLYAVVKGIAVVREDYSTELIKIAFNPLEEKFEVSDPAIMRDKAFISNISTVWAKDADIFDMWEKHLVELRATREVSDQDARKIRNAFNRLQQVLQFPLTALQLSAAVSEEQVSDVFVRINSEGKKLNQTDFILTLMSVFWEEGRKQLEDFCREARVAPSGEPSPFNHFIRPGPDQLLRVGVGLAFRRARLQHVYSILRGKDLETGEMSAERRESQFNTLKQAQERVLNIQYWQDFLKAVVMAGYRSEKLISAEANLLYSYVFYLIGRTEYKVDEFVLRKTIAQWFFMTALTGRYSSSPESKMEFDLARLRSVKTADEFVSLLGQICDATVTSDFWSITLPNELATSAARSPSLFAYFAALNLLDAKVLFSKSKVSELMDPATQARRAALERHHLFPRGFLKAAGVTDLRDVNQIANFTVVEWGDNGKISDSPPSEYVPKLSSRFSAQEMTQMREWHALPEGWENMDYEKFLRSRRELMAKVISNAYAALTKGVTPKADAKVLLADLVSQGEGTSVEFKATLRTNLHTGQKDPRMEHAILRTMAAFLNSSGGTLIVGVTDDGNPVGLEADKFESADKMLLHLDNMVRGQIGPQHTLNIQPRFDEFEGTKVLAIECRKGSLPVYVKDGATERFYVRGGASTTELTPSQMQEFIRQRFH